MQNGTIQLLQITPDQLTQLIEKGVENQIKKHLEAKPSPEQLLTREQAAKMLNCDIGTLWRWNKRGTLKAVAIGNRVYYKHSDIMAALEPING
jgi:excisionase family DNA binding protein